MLKKILAAGLLCAGMAMAQGSYGGGRSRGGGELDPTASRPRSYNRFDTIVRVLNLDREQEKTVRTILEDGAKEAAPIRDQMSKSRIVVGEAIASNKGEDELKQLAKSSSDLDARLSELEIQAFAKTFAALNETQKKDMQSLGRTLFLMNGMYHIKNWTEP
ncbi:MAG TPA: periplasmic heavy metal sensor [Bryobacteraceae bacterium]|nr:periplasmic heavy metal sensor [Bryobacteraceae bacterium]